MQQAALMGVFQYVDDFLNALEAVKQGNLEFTTFTPTARHEIGEIMGLKPSPVRRYTLIGGLCGAILGPALGVYTVLAWKFVVSGKPVIPWVPFVIVAFEFTILLGVLFTLAGVLISARMPNRKLPGYYDPRFSNDRFGIMVSCGKEEQENVTRLLREAGAEEVHELQV
jgi:molybdopterin-containing oxidoreductase family membrane subunit